VDAALDGRRERLADQEQALADQEQALTERDSHVHPHA
jgi:hypothetical protein